MALTVTDTNENFDTWISKEFVPQDLRDSLSNAAIMMVPFENLREDTGPLFPTGTEELFRYFKENLPKEIQIDICIADEDYQEFAFYNDYKRLGHFIITAIAVPVFVGILSPYIYDNYIKHDESKPQIQIIDNSTKNIDNSTHTTINNHISTLADKKYLEPTHIKFSITIVNDTLGTAKNISYEGPAANIDSVLKVLKEYEQQ